MNIIILLNVMFIIKREHNTFLNSFTNDLTCKKNLNVYNQNMYKLRKISVFAF